MSHFRHLDGCGQYGVDTDIPYNYNNKDRDAAAYTPEYLNTYPRHVNRGYMRNYGSDYEQIDLRDTGGNAVYDMFTINLAVMYEPRITNGPTDYTPLLMVYTRDAYPIEQLAIGFRQGQLIAHRRYYGNEFDHEIMRTPIKVFKNFRWSHVEIQAIMGGEEDGYLYVEVNGETYHNRWDSTMYSPSPSGQLSHIRIDGSSGIYTCITDVAIQVGYAYEGDQTICGPSIIDVLSPDSNSTPLQFTPSPAASGNYECVSQEYWGDDTDVCVRGTALQRDVYGFEDLPDIGLSTIHALGVAVLGTSEGGTPTYVTGCVGLVTHTNSQLLGDVTGTGYGIEQFIWSTNPNFAGAVNWTTLSVNNNNYGVYVG